MIIIPRVSYIIYDWGSKYGKEVGCEIFFSRDLPTTTRATHETIHYNGVNRRIDYFIIYGTTGCVDCCGVRRISTIIRYFIWRRKIESLLRRSYRLFFFHCHFRRVAMFVFLVIISTTFPPRIRLSGGRIRVPEDRYRVLCILLCSLGLDSHIVFTHVHII